MLKQVINLFTIGKKLFIFILLLQLTVIALASSKTNNTFESNNISIKIDASEKIDFSQKISTEKNGLQKLTVTLKNNGSKTASINNIEICIPLTTKLTESMKIAYGSSSMGQRPVLIHSLGEAQKTSYSYMYAMIQAASSEYLFAGALSWKTFIPIITLENNEYLIRSNGEGRQLKPGESVQYEPVVFGATTNWNQLLSVYAAAIATENGIKKVKKAAYTGWATWDYYAYKFSDKDIYENMDLMKQMDPTTNLIQIDAGWYTQRGDFAKSRTDLPGGMKAIADRIKAAGMTPGIWIDGFRANTDSEVFKNHPEYFLHDNEGNVIIQQRRPEGPDRDRVYLDYSHPGARAHIAECVRVITKEMGFPYLKVDFIVMGLNNEILKANPKFNSIKPFDSSITDVERVRIGLKTIRQAAGNDTYILGCSAVFGPCFGYVDGMRTGGDVSPRFDAFPERSLANAGNYYLSGKVFNGDADYLVFRSAEDEDEGVSAEHVKNGGTLTLNEAQMWADFNKFYGNVRLSSDKLKTLRPERKAIVNDVFSYPAMDERLPVDFWQHGKDKSDGYELLLARKGESIYLGIFNWSDTAKEYKLDAFGIGTQKLNARHSKVIKYTGKKSYNEIRNMLINSMK